MQWRTKHGTNDNLESFKASQTISVLSKAVFYIQYGMSTIFERLFVSSHSSCHSVYVCWKVLASLPKRLGFSIQNWWHTIGLMKWLIEMPKIQNTRQSFVFFFLIFSLHLDKPHCTKTESHFMSSRPLVCICPKQICFVLFCFRIVVSFSSLFFWFFVLSRFTFFSTHAIYNTILSNIFEISP